MAKIFNAELSLLSSSARTATTSSAQIDSSDLTYKGVKAVIDITSVSTSGSVSLVLEGYDETLGKYFTLISSAALTSSGITVVNVHPDLTAVTNKIAQDFLTDKWKATVTHTGFDGTNPASVTYAVSAHMLD